MSALASLSSRPATSFQPLRRTSAAGLAFQVAGFLLGGDRMPGMTGVELHRQLIKLGYAIPTILVTAYPDEAVRKQALKDGVFCYLSKPVDDGELESCLRTALKGGRPTKENSLSV
jgi:FixJ family two-component response regulator